MLPGAQTERRGEAEPVQVQLVADQHRRVLVAAKEPT
jgi:hypothetical protein